MTERDASGDSLLKSLEKPQGAHRGGSPRGQHRDASSEAMFRQTKAINNQARSKRFDTICRALLENNEEFKQSFNSCVGNENIGELFRIMWNISGMEYLNGQTELTSDAE